MPEYVLARNIGGQYGAKGDTYTTDDEVWAAQMIAAGHFVAPAKGEADAEEPDEGVADS